MIGFIFYPSVDWMWDEAVHVAARFQGDLDRCFWSFSYLYDLPAQ